MNDDMETVFPLPLWFVLLVTVLFGCPASATAAPVFNAIGSNGKPIQIRLLEEPCRAVVLQHIKSEFHGRFKRAVLLWDGKHWESCWTDHHGVIHSIDEEGSVLQQVPRAVFRDDAI